MNGPIEWLYKLALEMTRNWYEVEGKNVRYAVAGVM